MTQYSQIYYYHNFIITITKLIFYYFLSYDHIRLLDFIEVSQQMSLLLNQLFIELTSNSFYKTEEVIIIDYRNNNNCNKKASSCTYKRIKVAGKHGRPNIHSK